MSLARNTLVHSTRPPRQQYNLRIQNTKIDPEEIFLLDCLSLRCLKIDHGQEYQLFKSQGDKYSSWSRTSETVLGTA